MKLNIASPKALIILLVVTNGIWATATAQQPATAGSAPQPPASSPDTYRPKFPGDPAHSDAEALALAYMRVVIRAQNLYKRRHQHYAPSLAELAGTGSFTKRMARTTDRGDYGVEFHSKNKGEAYSLSMVPKQFDAEHRAFFASADGVIHAEGGKPATEESPRIK
ncbi:MAG: hypothetical protein JO249_06960 [Acidobacteria bacterium]|nr:hypothetical protein [Acidobacteriota bacterium]